MKLVFATNNQHKLSEVRKMLNDDFNILSLTDIGFSQEIPEPYDTLEENSKTKALTIFKKFNVNCIAEDTGLEIEALNGKPGVLSARYAGNERNAENNMTKVLRNLEGLDNRNAQFRTVVTLILNESIYQFEGICKGTILHNKLGEEGFGYDPIFMPNNYSKSFAQMSAETKNSISHRGKAINKLVDFLLNTR